MDMVIIIIGKFHALTSNHLAADIWNVFGMQCPGKNHILPIFHGFTYTVIHYSFMGEREDVSMGGMESILRGN